MSIEIIRTIIAKQYKGEIPMNEAYKELANSVTREQLAEFVVDSFNRGWITRFNLGIDEDGNLM